MTVIGMNYQIVEDIQRRLLRGSTELSDRLTQLGRDLMSLSEEGQGEWIAAFTQMKADWDKRMVNLAQILDRTANQLKLSATAMQDVDAEGARAFRGMSV